MASENHTNEHEAPLGSAEQYDRATSPVNPARRDGIARRLLGQAPTLVVLAVLGGIAWWGHHTEWKIVRFSQVVGAAPTEEKEDWCAEHSVPQSQCIACNPELGGGNPADWCKEHGVPESKDPVCHPELLTKGVAGDWCKEHGVPESACTVCHPEIALKGSLPVSDVVATVLPPLGTAATQPTTSPAASRSVVPSYQKPDMALAEPLVSKPDKDAKTCQTHARRVQFASPESVRKAGVQFASVLAKPMSATMRLNAETDYDRTRYAQVASPVSGRAWRVLKRVGEPVRQGDVLALVGSAEVANAKAALLEASATLELRSKTIKRLRDSAEKGFRTEAELQEAEAALKEADIRLFNAQQALLNLGLPIGREDMEHLSQSRAQFLGLPDSVIKALDPKTAPANLLPLVAPLDGVVTDRSIVAGEVVDTTKPLFVVADPGHLWVVIDVPQGESRRVQLGQEVTFRPDGARDVPATGKVSWISTTVDDQTRTVRVRVDVENPDSRVLARTFGQAEITIRHAPNAIAIPDEAIQWEGCCYVAFVRLTDTVFQTRKLRIGARMNGYTEVLVGVLPGEIVATGGSHVFKAEILKANLGAGCTD